MVEEKFDEQQAGVIPKNSVPVEVQVFENQQDEAASDYQGNTRMFQGLAMDLLFVKSHRFKPTVLKKDRCCLMFGAVASVDGSTLVKIGCTKCDITPLDNLTAPTYLGRPWKNYSTTVIMQSSIGRFLHPLGWAEWDRGVEPPSSIFYAEYQNTGPGSTVDERVNWPSYKPRLTSAQAAKFNVRSFIDGSTWLP